MNQYITFAIVYWTILYVTITDCQPYSFLGTTEIPQPQVLSEGQVFRADIGDTLMLPCEVENLGPMILLWKKGTRVLTAGEMKVRRDDRIDLKGTNLQIHSVDVEDGGTYSCEIEADSEYPLTVTHNVEVLVPPSLDSTNDHIVVRSGTTVALKCKASGNPPPTIEWRKINDRLPIGGVISDNGMTLTMSKVSRHHAGVYECKAANGVAHSIKVEIVLKVMYGPEASPERPIVHGGLGLQTELSCIVYAVPAPEVVWYRDTMRLDPNGKRYMESRGSKYTLIIKKVEAQDFANYSCYASNTLGKAWAYITLRGNPNPPVFNSLVLSKSQTSYKISWVTESYSPISEYRLFYRMLPPSDSRRTDKYKRAWHKLRLPPASTASSSSGTPPSTAATKGIYQESYILGPLHPDSSYEAKAMAKNSYGWSEESETFQFYTQGEAFLVESF